MEKRIRVAKEEDLLPAMKCIKDAKVFLRKNGSVQWNGLDGYPNVDDIKEDIKLSRLYVCEIDNTIAGVVAYDENEKEYAHPFGAWLCNTNQYITIHRIAVNDSFRGCGVAQALIEFSFEYARRLKKKSVRVDTHEKNIIMQHIAQKMGFTHCGYVIYKRIEVEPKRLIYEKLI